MKKAITILMLAVFVVLLCGCSTKSAVVYNRGEYIVSAIGFDNNSNNIQMTVEAIVVNSDSPQSPEKSEIFSGSGTDITQAFFEINKKITQPLMFSHTGVVAMGESLLPNQINEVLKFCYEKDEINLAAMFVATANAKKLLSCKAVSSVAVGYDIMNMTQVMGEKTNFKFKNRFYEVEANRNAPTKNVSLPYFAVSDGSVIFEGINIYEQDQLIKKDNFSEKSNFNGK